MRYFTLFVYFFFMTLDTLSVSGEKNETNFVATHEWQPVKKGQPIPSGLHVRYNFQTGITEAKLLDKDEEADDNDTDDDKKAHSSLTLHSDALVDNDNNNNILGKDPTEPNNNLKLSLEELKTRLKKIKLDAEEELQKESAKDVKKSFRSYEELKEDFKALDMNITTDSEILTNLFQRFKFYDNSLQSGTLQDTEVENIIQIFNDLEYLLHQIDNAQLFADMGGMSKIISPCLNTTNDVLKIEALRILGTAVQSNPKVQIKALNNDLIQKLLHQLTLNNNVALRSRCLFALSALVRQFPAAQKTLIDHGGLEIFGKILEDGQLIVQLRVMKLITDLAVERKHLEVTNDKRLLKFKLEGYEKTDFERKLVLHKYCKSLSNIIKKSVKQSLSVDSTMETYDFLEVTLENMIALSGTCKHEFRDKDNALLETMNVIMDYYSIINDTRPPEEIEMFENLAKQISRLRDLIFDDNNHDEL